MRTLVLRAERAESLQRALALLRDGGLVAFPTDTVYGLGALAFNGEAVESIYRAKERPADKAIPILLADASALELVAADISDTTRRLAARFWPGPLTLITWKKQSLPRAVSATATVGVRVPDHAAARALLHVAGPMAVTSANLSGRPSSTSAQEVLAQLGGRIELILDGGNAPGGMPSTVVDLTQPELVIVRAGPVSLKDVKEALA
jgi:L-threonylcarbamoyladenylate synthase